MNPPGKLLATDRAEIDQDSVLTLSFPPTGWVARVRSRSLCKAICL